IGLETRTDDERLHLLGAFRSGVGSRPFGQEVFWCPFEDSVADVIIGFARFEAEAGGKLAFGEAAEFPECNHADLLLDGLFLGERERPPRVISEATPFVLDLQ